jgi:transposase
METITTIGLDIAKSVFQVHGVDAAGQVVMRRQLRRRQVLSFFQKLPPCLVGIEACASSHHWSRELQALGHHVKAAAVGHFHSDHSVIFIPIRLILRGYRKKRDG